MPQSNDPAGPRKIPLVFFKTAAGTEPVRDWLLDLDADDRKVVGFDLMQVQFAKRVRKSGPRFSDPTRVIKTGPSACRCADRSVKVCGRCAATCHWGASPA